MSSKGKRANALINEYVELTEGANDCGINFQEQVRIKDIRAELQALAGDGRACWSHDDRALENGPGWTLVVRWATGGMGDDRWYKELYQARAALALLAHGEVSDRGMSADLTPENAQFTSRAWIERERG